MAKTPTNQDPAPLAIVNRSVADLIEAEYNPRQLTETQHRHLTDSLKRFGMVDPLIVNRHPDRDSIVIGGHQRLRIWRELGNVTIPTVEVSLDRDQERELNIRLNKNNGEWDWDALANEFDAAELTGWGFDEEELTGAPGERGSGDGTGADSGVIYEQAVQLAPEREYIVVMCDQDSAQFDELTELLALGRVRRGGYKRGSAFDAIGTERVVPAHRLLAILKGQADDNSGTE